MFLIGQNLLNAIMRHQHQSLLDVLEQPLTAPFKLPHQACNYVDGKS